MIFHQKNMQNNSKNAFLLMKLIMLCASPFDVFCCSYCCRHLIWMQALASPDFIVSDFSFHSTSKIFAKRQKMYSFLKGDEILFPIRHPSLKTVIFCAGIRPVIKKFLMLFVILLSHSTLINNGYYCRYKLIGTTLL